MDVSAYQDLLGLVWDLNLNLVKIGDFPVGSRLSLSAGLAVNSLGPVCSGGGPTGLFTPFWGVSSSFVKDPC